MEKKEAIKILDKIANNLSIDERIKYLIYVLDIEKAKAKSSKIKWNGEQEFIYKTRWGYKTEKGLIETIKNIMNGEGVK
jgi:hypothetical protein